MNNNMGLKAPLKEIIPKVKELREVKKMELKELLNDNTALKFTIKNSITEKFIIVHPSTRENYKYQISFFDNRGAEMDEKCESIEEVIEILLKGVVYNQCGEVYFKYELTEVVR